MTEEKVRVLLVDDEEDWLDGFAKDLEDTGEFTVTKVLDSSYAVTTAKRYLPELIILDIEMGEHLDGGTVRKFLESDQELRKIPVVYISDKFATTEEVKVQSRTGRLRIIAKGESFEDQLARIVAVLVKWNPDTSSC